MSVSRSISVATGQVCGISLGGFGVPGTAFQDGSNSFELAAKHCSVVVQKERFKWG